MNENVFTLIDETWTWEQINETIKEDAEVLNYVLNKKIKKSKKYGK